MHSHDHRTDASLLPKHEITLAISEPADGSGKGGMPEAEGSRQLPNAKQMLLCGHLQV